MQNINERPVCHRAEDLVTYLYDEATAEEARDFSAHMQQCDACRAEFTVFHQVHDSIVTWRNEAIGSVFEVPQSTSAASAVAATDQFVRHERKLWRWLRCASSSQCAAVVAWRDSVRGPAAVRANCVCGFAHLAATSYDRAR